MATLDELIGESRPMVELRRRVDNLLGKVAGLRALPPILIRGETGTGKTTLARLIHRASARVDGPFVDVNCAEFQEALLESQLFGHERHTFTGAGPGRTGLFQAAHRGVLLLDEISEMSIGLQAKLLKVLDDGAMRVRRLGATRLEAVDVAVIAATHADLRTAVAEGRFRRDLYSRLTGFTLQVPALRQRFGDIELLAEHFLARACEQYGLVPKLLGDDARAALRAYAWPGNVRELANVIRRAALESESSTVTAGDLDLDVDGPAPSQAGGEDLPQRLLEALTRTSWNITHTAAALGLTRKTVRERIRRYGLESRRPQGAAGASTARDAVERTNPAEAGPSREPASAARHAPGGSPLPNPVVAVRWTRRRITLLRARVRHDAALPLAVTTRVLQTVIEQVQGFHGRIESLSPHGMVAVFGLEPDEDAPRRAAYAALAIVRSREPGVGDDLLPAGLSIAVGLHMTSMLIADVAGTVTLDEDAKTDAWRTLEDLTGGSSADGVALSDSAAQSLGRRFEIVRHAEAGRVAARLVGPGSSDVRFGPSEFLGRQRELALLEGLLERAIEGRGQVALIAGEPGIGKSRLVYEFTERQTPEEHALLVGQCVSYGTQVPYHLTLDMLRHVCGIQDTDQPDAIVTKTHAVLERMGAAKAPWAPYVLNLLCPGGDPAVSEAPPEIVREKTFEALLQLVMLQQERQPLILVVEDLHWIDPVSEELLGTIAAGAVGQRVLLLCTVRPGYQVPWITRSHATQIALPPLSAETSRHLVQSALGGQLVAEDVVKTILARGEGNPFFLEELVRVLRDGDARSRVGIPATIHDVLSARILRLPEEDRHIFQVAAVIGRDVPLALLETVLGLPPDLVRAGLTRLQSAEFLYPVRVGADAAHTFSHALTWDVANELLLEEERRALHVAVVAGIERCYAARLSDHVERLADHAEQGRRWDAAVEFCRQAGHKAIAHSAYREAVSYFTRALTALEHLPPDPAVLRQGIDVRFDLRTALVPLGEFARVVQVLLELESLTEQLGDQPRQGRVAALMTGVMFGIGQYQQAAHYGERARTIAEQCQDEMVDVLGHCYLSPAYFFLGDYGRAIACGQHVVDVLPPERSHESFSVAFRPAVYVRGFLSWALSEVGRFDEAWAVAQDALALAEATNHPPTVACGLLATGTFHVRHGDFKEAVTPFERAYDLCQRHDIPLWRPTCASFLGYSLVLSGRLAEGEALLQTALDQAAAMGMVVFHSQMLMWLAEARVAEGAIQQAEELAGVALTATRDRSEVGFEAWALRLAAEVAMHRVPIDVTRADALYRDAMGRAESCGMRPLVARCHLGLGTLHRRAGNGERAAEHLAAARAMFRDMDLRFWCDRADTEFELLAGGGHASPRAGSVESCDSRHTPAATC